MSDFEQHDMSESVEERKSRTFIFNCHGGTIVGESIDKITGKLKKKLVVIKPVMVDTITTASVGCSYGYSLYDPRKGFLERPELHFFRELEDRVKRRVSESGEPELEKNELREMILDSLCQTRDNGSVVDKDVCRFKCHKVGGKMADMYLFAAGAPSNDQVLEFDPYTGNFKDVHEKFGLRESDRVKIPGTKPIPFTNIEIRHLEKGLSDLYNKALSTKDKNEKQELLKQHSDNSKIAEVIREKLRGSLWGPQYRFTPPHQHKYDKVKSGYMIKLSTLLEIAIENKTIKRDDFVVALSCRDYNEDYSGEESPGRSSEESPGRSSEDGKSKRSRSTSRGGSITRKKNRKIVKNKNNKNNKKRKTRRLYNRKR